MNTGPPLTLEQQLREMNEALLLSSIRQHELTELAEQANAALREGERRFREMIDALPAAVYTTDADGRLTHFNPAAIEFAGRTPELGTDQWCLSWKLYRPDGTPLPHDECPTAVALKEGRIVRGVEAVAERPDGSRVWGAPYPALLRDAAGRVTGGITMVVDITERKRMEERLRQSEAFSRGILENSPDCVKVLDAAGRVMGMNANGRCLMEIDDFATVEGCQWCDLWPREGRTEVLEAVEAARAGGTGKFQRFCPTAKGTPKWWDVIVAPIRNADGEVVRFVSVSRDVTQSKQDEEALREGQSRLRHAADAAGLTYVEVDLTRGTARTAENFAAVMGYAAPSEQDVDVSVGSRLLLEHVVPRDRPGVEAAIEDFLGGKPVGKIEYRVLGDDQIERCIESMWSIEFGSNGKPLKTFATNLDVTERRKADEALRESQRFLRSSLDALSGHIAVLDESGTILEVNEAWRRFAEENQFIGVGYGIGASYLQDYHQTFPQECETPPYTKGINDVIAGRQARFELEYP